MKRGVKYSIYFISVMLLLLLTTLFYVNRNSEITYQQRIISDIDESIKNESLSEKESMALHRRPKVPIDSNVILMNRLREIRIIIDTLNVSIINSVKNGKVIRNDFLDSVKRELKLINTSSDCVALIDSAMSSVRINNSDAGQLVADLDSFSDEFIKCEILSKRP